MISVLKDYRALSLKAFLGDEKAVLAAEHALQVAIQSMLDIGNHLLADMGANSVEEYRDILVELGKKGIIPTDLASAISDLAGLRNILVHGYLRISLEKLHSIIRVRLDDFTAFSRHILKYLKKRKPLSHR